MSKPILYDFAKGHPNNHELPVDELCEMFRSVNIDSLRRALQYGQECGNPDLIKELSKFIALQCQNDSGTSNQATRSLFITEGVSHGIDLLTLAATKPGDIVLTECPTYFLISGIFQSHGLVIETIPTRSIDGGVDIETLDYEFQTNTRSIPRLIYIIPAYQNPSGQSMSAIDRQMLTDLAYKYKILVVADEVYHLLDWGTVPREARMVTWEPSDRLEVNTTNNDLFGCVSVSSFTKIFGPGVRCGWIEADRHIIDAVQNIGYIQSQGAVGPVMGSVLATGLISGAVERVLNNLCQQYKSRCNLLCDILEQEPSMKLVGRPTGGFFIWIRLPDTICDATNDFLEYCIDRGVRYMPGPRCHSCSYSDSNIRDNSNAVSPLQCYARLCFAKLSTSEIQHGAELFIDCYRSYMKHRG